MSDPIPDRQPLGRQARPIQEALLAWYAAERRDLPWRRTSDPYSIWVSEVMLQQTQVATVIPYYQRFLSAFPTVCALAAADLDRMLALWAGLGYYARARHLHAAARLVMERHGGEVPGDPAAFRALPGVGPYIAAAVLSIAFGQDVAAIDTNAARVLCRLFDYAGDLTRAAGKRTLRALAAALLPAGRAAEHNAAMMELGATICLARGPRCA
ncbi:MAG: A/G-specific adenine glycosylase, partial [Chloroflexi bacterium]|nr:A/G-specific adenine glycosylase [Chloroflexota bacterium]